MPPEIATALASIPPLTYRIAAVVLFTLSALVLAVHTLIIAAAAQRASLSPSARIAAPLVAATVLALWLGVSLVVADGAHFPLGAGVARLPLTFGVMAAGVVTVLGMLATSRTFRAINAAAPAEWLVWPQVYRLAGGIFLFPFMAYGVLPGGFAWPAGLGDMLTGALAPVVALALVRDTPRARTWAVLWNLFGIIDLIVAPLSAFLSQAQVVTAYPLPLVPLFLGPPLGMLLHLLSLRNLWVNRASARLSVRQGIRVPAGV
jgi:hypothetical protein